MKNREYEDGSPSREWERNNGMIHEEAVERLKKIRARTSKDKDCEALDYVIAQLERDGGGSNKSECNHLFVDLEITFNEGKRKYPVACCKCGVLRDVEVNKTMEFNI